MNIYLRIIVVLVGLLISGIFLFFVIRNKRRLDQRIEEFHKEMENRQTPINPYEEFAKLYAEDMMSRNKKRGGKPKKQ
jgi:hypothetical protein